MTVLTPVALERFDEVGGETEIDDLRLLARHGLPVAPAIVIPGAAEAAFYQLNNLYSRIEALFSRVDLADPDDEDILDLAPEAGRLVGSHFLLDEFIDDFYRESAVLPSQVRVRRAAESGDTAARGRDSLLALKSAWSREWSFPNLWRRLEAGGPLLPAARPLLVQSAALQRLTVDLELEATALAGRPLQLFGDPVSGITVVRDLPLRAEEAAE